VLNIFRTLKIPQIKHVWQAERGRAYEKGWEAHLGLFFLASPTPESS